MEIVGVGGKSIKRLGYMCAASQGSVLARVHFSSSRSPARAVAFEGSLVGTSVQVEVQESEEEEEEEEEDDDEVLDNDRACAHCKGRDIVSVSSISKYA